VAAPVKDRHGGARPGAKARVRFVRMSASKVRVVLNLIRGKRVGEAIEILQYSERLAAKEVLKALQSAVANAEHNEDIPEEELFVSACFADVGPTLRRYRPRARGRAGRIQKQTCHITIEVSRLTDDELDDLRGREELKEQSRQSTKTPRSGGADRAKRVAKSRAAADGDATGDQEAADDGADEQVADDQDHTDTDAVDDEDAASSDGEEE